MTVFVLMGAGASYGSEEDKESVPPLGIHLFGEVEKFSGAKLNIPEYIRRSFYDHGFESGMAFYYSERPKEFHMFQRELASYLVRFAPTSDSLYLKLFMALGVRHTIYSSLNYDVMFEIALMRWAGLATCYGLESGAKRVQLIKPHGSSNVWPDFGGNNFDGGYSPAFESTYQRCLNQAESIERFRTENYFSPCMAMYAKGKEVVSCASWVKEQQRVYAEVCGAVATIFIIGVAVVEEDEHIWGPLSKTKARIIYFGNEADGKSFSSWKTRADPASAHFVSGYFDCAIKYIQNLRLTNAL